MIKYIDTEEITPIMAEYVADVFSRKEHLDDISYGYCMEIAETFRRYAERAKQEQLEMEQEEKKLPEGLEEAAEKSASQYYVDGGYSPFQNVETAAHEAGFIAGAEWQKKRDDLETADLLAIAHLQGMEQQKAKMLEDAVEAVVTTNLANGPIIYLDQLQGFQYGDKVRVIVIKEDEK